ncbi:MAG: CrcB family protein [Candidatus Adiutrix sp.]|jgi:CrcB protein|nr:CrcB family protein [Candidatus Adiutrix sp.]
MAFKHIFLVFCAGGFGALSRFALTVLVNRLANGQFPWGTLTVNMLGCFIFGFLWELIGSRSLSDPTRVILLVGFIGSFTTFSSFIFDNYALIGQRPDLALINIIFQNIAGFIFLYGGIHSAKIIFG